MDKNTARLLFMLAAAAFILHFMGIRVCPVYNLLHIPCPGCGITRASLLLLQGRVRESLRYNILPIPLAVLLLGYCTACMAGHKQTLDRLLQKYSLPLIIISGAAMLIVWQINRENILLY